MDPGTGRRKGSKLLPPDLSELMNKLIEYGASFIKEFDTNEAEMRRIVDELKKIIEELKVEQERKNRQRKIGAAVTGVGGLAAAAVFAAPFTGGLSLAVAGAVAGAAAAGGGGTVVHANVTKLRLEAESANKVEKLGKEFQLIVEPLKKILEEIQTTCERLEQKSTELQAKHTLRDMEEFKEILRRVSALKKRSEGAVETAVILIQEIANLLVFIVNVFRIFPTPEADEKLRESIRESADQCQRLIDEFDQMKKELRSFETK
ncbi:apolipoprotein L4-like [Parambassis ranga]|uniref:Apolipoprotein L4-like n=1 Tax=Parambassis ranga TaxID=210632 RepID=A0A6P7JAX4_9TELE|nr:apolipoprotein L4-like [Parambassis ranga]XP_028273804.1 apolipoprotein L4-like [Parambassis ranga]XP_028273805.1 apolipoprotein L4-like [Parambassis ranga]